MILFFTAVSVAAAILGLYYLLGTEWKHLTPHQRVDAVLCCTLLAVISVLSLAASFSGPFR